MDAALTINDEIDGKSQHAAEALGQFVVAHSNRIVHVELPVELFDGFGVVVHGDADNLKALRAVFLLHLYKVRNLGAARSTPGGPEVEQNDLSFVIGQRKLFAVDVSDGEFGGCVARGGGLRFLCRAAARNIEAQPAEGNDAGADEALRGYNGLAAGLKSGYTSGAKARC